MNKPFTYLIFRKSNDAFFSIENVFNTLIPYLEGAKKINLPFESKGLKNRLKNIIFLFKYKNNLLHITGHDHYLLWFPFKNAILTIHDIEALKRKSGIKRWFFKKLWFDIPITNAREVITISNFTKNEILELNDYKTPIHVIHNPLTMNLTCEPKLEWGKTINVLHIGTKNNKNLLNLIRALKGVECELTIIGKLAKNHELLLTELKVNYRNLFNLSDSALENEYSKCDLLAFVSTYEGFGLPIIEAQAKGRVVLTSNLASMPEVAGDGAYFVDPFSIQSIRKGIVELRESQHLREELIQKGLKNIQRFVPRTVAKEYEQKYKDIEAT